MKNNLLSEKLQYSGTSQAPTNLSISSYNATEIREAHGKLLKNIDQVIDNSRINWLHISGLKDAETVRSICEHFNIDFLTAQDILNPNHLPKIEEHDTYTFLILKLFRFNEADKDDELERQQIAIIQGANFVLTFTEHESPILDEVTQAIQNDVLKIRSRQSDYLLSVLLNSVITNYISIISSIDDSLEDLEEELLSITNARDIGRQIQALRKQYLQIKKGVLPLKEQYVKLLRTEATLMHKANRAFFNDVNDHLQLVLQTIEICRETLSSLVDLYISNNDLRMNDIMKRLTVVSTIFIPITFLAGVWGMNFEFMPELDWKYGYLAAWLLMLAIGGAIYLFFKKKKWY